MSEAPDFRGWAARVARQAGEEPDADEARRLMGIAEYWVRLAEIASRLRPAFSVSCVRPRVNSCRRGLICFCLAARHYFQGIIGVVAVLWPRPIAHPRCNCGAEYKRTETKFLVPHTGDAVCGAALESWWNSTHFPHSNLSNVQTESRYDQPPQTP